MKIKLALCTTDKGYADKFVNYFSIHYADRMEFSQFTQMPAFLEFLKKGHPDICLIGEENAGEIKALKTYQTAFVLLAEERGALEDVPSIFKYQKAELIFKELLNIYADSRKGSRLLREHVQGEAHTYAFCSPSGGSGATTIALAYAMRLAKQKPVLYLNLQQYGNADLILNAEGNGKFDDVIFALKSKRGSLSLKLESLVRRSRENVDFFVSCNNPLDLQELTGEELLALLREVVTCGLYEYVIVDMDSQLGDREFTVLNEVEHIIAVEGGNEENGIKFEKFYVALEAAENRRNMDLVSKLSLFYNKFSNKTGSTITERDVRVAGGSPKIEGVPMEGVIGRIVLMDCLNTLMHLGGKNEG